MEANISVNVRIAGIPMCCELSSQRAAAYLRGWECSDEPQFTVRADEGLTEKILNGNSDVKDYSCAEFNALAYAVSKKLLKYNIAVFHGCAFFWKGMAYLFTAPSGTGKTTQYVQWKRIYGDELRIINGDKPVIRLEDDGKIIVATSPWKGKERMSGDKEAPLGGIILLEQAEANEISGMKSSDAVLRIYRQFVVTPENADEVKAVCTIEDAMLRNAPVWLLKNRGDMDSARLTHDTVEAYSVMSK